MPRSLVVAAALLLLCACGSYKKDLQTLCDSPTRVELADADPSQKATRLAEYISKNITTEQAKTFFWSLATLAPDEKSKALRRELDKVGIGKCAILDDAFAGPAEPAPAPAK